jgi:protein TonB
MLFMGLFSAALTLSIQVPTTGAVGGFLAITAVITGGIYLFKYVLNRQTAKLLQQKSDTSKKSSTLRKYDEVGIFKYSGTIYTGGFATALLICFLAINWTTSETEKVEEKVEMDLTQAEVELDVQNTPPPPPPPPPPTTATTAAATNYHTNRR